MCIVTGPLHVHTLHVHSNGAITCTYIICAYSYRDIMYKMERQSDSQDYYMCIVTGTQAYYLFYEVHGYMVTVSEL